MKKSILLLEDNQNIQAFNKAMLEEEGFFVSSASTVAEASEFMASEKFDLVVLDIGLPDGSGLDFLKIIKQDADLPVLVLSGFNRDEDIVRGFLYGCDDYLGKPYSFDVLYVRILRLLKQMDVAKKLMSKGNLTLDLFEVRAYVNGTDLGLTLRQFSLLKLFVEREDEVMSPEEIYRKIWGQEIIKDTRSLANSISRLRKKIEGSEYEITSVYGGGYRFSKE